MNCEIVYCDGVLSYRCRLYSRQERLTSTILKSLVQLITFQLQFLFFRKPALEVTHDKPQILPAMFYDIVDHNKLF